MEVIAQEEGRHVCNLARGEELFETLLSWLNKNKVRGGTLTGLGAADALELAYYNLETQEYERHHIKEDVEILSLVGNVGIAEGKTMMHVHGTFGRRDLSTFGGHLFTLRVSGACEIHLTTFASPFERKKDGATGLNLLCGVAV